MDNSSKEKIVYEISRIDKSLADVKPLLDICKIKSEPDIIEKTAAAQVLHSFYNGVESIVLLFLKSINEKIPNDYRWHKTLLEMAFGGNSKNTVILGSDVKEQIEKYMYFRHFIRHAYGSELKWQEMKSLLKDIEEIWGKIKNNFEIFIKNN